MLPRPPLPTLFPYTTLFRSHHGNHVRLRDRLSLADRQRLIGVGAPPVGRCDEFFAGHTAHRRSEEHTSELQSLTNLVCRLLLEKKKKKTKTNHTHSKLKNKL